MADEAYWPSSDWRTAKSLNNKMWFCIGWFAYRFSQFVVTLLNTFWWRTEVHGRHNIPKNGAFIVAPTHRSNVDGPIASTFMQRRMRFLAKQELFKYESLGKLFHSMGAIAVNRGAPDRRSLNACKSQLDAGWPLVLFPEGGRKDGPLVTEVMEGATYLALRCKVAVVPIAIAGSEQANPRKSFFLRPSKIVVVIGSPITTFVESDSIEADNAGSKRIARAEVTTAKEQLTEELQRLLDEANARR